MLNNVRLSARVKCYGYTEEYLFTILWQCIAIVLDCVHDFIVSYQDFVFLYAFCSYLVITDLYSLHT